LNRFRMLLSDIRYKKRDRSQKILIHYWLHMVRKHPRFLTRLVAMRVLLSSWHECYFETALHACEIEILLSCFRYYSVSTRNSTRNFCNLYDIISYTIVISIIRNNCWLLAIVLLLLFNYYYIILPFKK